MICEFEDKIFNIDERGFEPLALDIFRFQAEQNPVYGEYIRALGLEPETVGSVDQIPFLPISFFKTHKIKTGHFEEETIFESSGTTGMIPSRHYVKDLGLYKKSFLRGFEHFYGPVEDWAILGLLPSYLERQHSSLVVMVDELIKRSPVKESGFYLYNREELAQVIRLLESRGQKTLLIGVTFGLLDFAEQFHLPLRHTIIMETGGMKGRRRELTREEVHQELQNAFQLSGIHAEYGMTELLSQAYSKSKGLFECPAWMKVLLREEDDPLTIHNRPNTSGLINVIDLANLYSCSFIATDDIGRLHPAGGFEVLGRMDHADMRGCSLMVV